MKKWADPEVMEEVVDFYRGLPDDLADIFDAAVERLAEVGPTLGRPAVGEINLRDYSQAIKALFGAHLKELRIGRTIRVLFTFGPDRVPVLLAAGDKAGEWTDWYPGAIREAADRYREYLKDRGLG